MYKVFFNERFLVLTGTDKITNRQTTGKLRKIGDLAELNRLVDLVKEGILEYLLVGHHNEGELWEKFRSLFDEIPAAGGLVRKGSDSLFIMRRGKWDLPKGKIERGETAQEAAVREVQEECGLDELKIIAQLPSTYHVYKSSCLIEKGKWILKETTWFEMEYSGAAEPLPDAEEDITAARWFGKGDTGVVLSNTWASLRPLIENYC